MMITSAEWPFPVGTSQWVLERRAGRQRGLRVGRSTVHSARQTGLTRVYSGEAFASLFSVPPREWQPHPAAQESQMVGAAGGVFPNHARLRQNCLLGAVCACKLPTSFSPSFSPAHFHPSVGLALRHSCPPRVRCASRCAATACAAMSSSARPSAERRRSVEVSRNGTGEPPAMRYSSTSKKSGLLLKRGKFLHRDGMFLLHKKSRFLVLEGPKLSCYKKVGGWGVSSCRGCGRGGICCCHCLGQQGGVSLRSSKRVCCSVGWAAYVLVMPTSLP